MLCLFIVLVGFLLHHYHRLLHRVIYGVLHLIDFDMLIILGDSIYWSGGLPKSCNSRYIIILIRGTLSNLHLPLVLPANSAVLDRSFAGWRSHTFFAKQKKSSIYERHGRHEECRLIFVQKPGCFSKHIWLPARIVAIRKQGRDVNFSLSLLAGQFCLVGNSLRVAPWCFPTICWAAYFTCWEVSSTPFQQLW